MTTVAAILLGLACAAGFVEGFVTTWRRIAARRRLRRVRGY